MTLPTAMIKSRLLDKQDGIQGRPRNKHDKLISQELKLNFTRRYTGWAKKVSCKRLFISSRNTGRFSKFFHWHTLLKSCNKAITEYLTTP